MPDSLCLEDLEPSSGIRWGDLIKESCARHVPQHVIAVALYEGQWQVYDYNHARSHVNIKVLSKVEDVHFLACQLFEFIDSGLKPVPQDSLIMKPLNFDAISPGGQRYYNNASNFRRLSKDQLAAMQYIVGAELWQADQTLSSEAWIWLACAEQNGSSEAKNIMTEHRNKQRLSLSQ